MKEEKKLKVDWSDRDERAAEYEKMEYGVHPGMRRPKDLCDVRPRTSMEANARKQEIITAGVLITVILVIVFVFLAAFVYKVTNGGCVMGGPKELCVRN